MRKGINGLMLPRVDAGFPIEFFGLTRCSNGLGRNDSGINDLMYPCLVNMTEQFDEVYLSTGNKIRTHIDKLWRS